MNVLNMTLKKKWFDLIRSGEKKEDYREIKDYWAKRFFYTLDTSGMEFPAWDEMLTDIKNCTRRHNSISELMKYFRVHFRLYDSIKFRNGYRKDSPEFTIEFKGIEIKQGRPEWGAVDGEYYFSIILGDILPVN